MNNYDSREMETDVKPERIFRAEEHVDDSLDFDPVARLLSSTLELNSRTSDVNMPRLGCDFKIRTLNDSEYQQLLERTAKSMTYNGMITRSTDGHRLMVLAIISATVSPNFNDKRILAVHRSAEVAVSAMLAPGEIIYLSDEIMKFSGFQDEIREEGATLRKIKKS